MDDGCCSHPVLHRVSMAERATEQFCLSMLALELRPYNHRLGLHFSSLLSKTHFSHLYPSQRSESFFGRLFRTQYGCFYLRARSTMALLGTVRHHHYI